MINELNRFLHEEIPATEFMQLQLIEFKQNNLTAKAPIQPNLNDKATFFGGSSSSLMIICAWSLVKILCKQSQINADIVIVGNQTKWSQPLNTDSIIESELISEWKAQKIKERLKLNKSTPLTLKSKLCSQDELICAEMTAKYFIIPKSHT